MVSSKSLIAFLFILSLGVRAHANDSWDGDRNNHDRDGWDSDVCNQTYDGTWWYKKGRWMTVSLRSNHGHRVDVTVSQKNGTYTMPGTCQTRGHGKADVTWGVGNYGGRLSVFSDGEAHGTVGGYGFDAEGTDDHWEGKAGCYGFISGTWYFKKGRSMTIDVQRGNGGHGDAIVTTNQKNGSFTSDGYCDRNHDGSARLEFGNGQNTGYLIFSRNGSVDGTVYGFQFNGFKQ